MTSHSQTDALPDISAIGLFDLSTSIHDGRVDVLGEHGAQMQDQVTRTVRSLYSPPAKSKSGSRTVRRKVHTLHPRGCGNGDGAALYCF